MSHPIHLHHPPEQTMPAPPSPAIDPHLAERHIMAVAHGAPPAASAAGDDAELLAVAHSVGIVRPYLALVQEA